MFMLKMKFRVRVVNTLNREYTVMMKIMMMMYQGTGRPDGSSRLRGQHRALGWGMLSGRFF